MAQLLLSQGRNLHDRRQDRHAQVFTVSRSAKLTQNEPSASKTTPGSSRSLQPKIEDRRAVLVENGGFGASAQRRLPAR